MHKSRKSLDKQQAAQMGYNPLLATAALSGCEIVKCQFYKDGKCNDTNEYVNRQGESVCGRREDAILYEDYLYYLNREKLLIYDKDNNEEGMSIYSNHFTKNEREQILDYIKYGRK